MFNAECPEDLMLMKHEAPEWCRIVPEGKSVSFHALMQPTAKKYLRRMADRLGVSMNEALNIILKDYIGKSMM